MRPPYSTLIDLMARHLLDVLGIDHLCPDTDLLQSGIGLFQ
jgi:hypothetical protein